MFHVETKLIESIHSSQMSIVEIEAKVPSGGREGSRERGGGKRLDTS